jgi:hypothetical protein
MIHPFFEDFFNVLISQRIKHFFAGAPWFDKVGMA